MIILKTKEEIERLKAVNRIVAEVRQLLIEKTTPGITTKELDQIAEENIRKLGGIPAFKGYRGFPATICASINEQVVHGIPDKRKLKEGDIISIDLGAILDGFVGDSAATVPVGDVDDEVQKLIDVTEKSLYIGIDKCRPHLRLGDISNAIQKFVESNGFSVVRDFVGHGIGREMHEDPQIPNFGPPDRGVRLAAGMVFALEPMVNLGDWKVKVLDDGWTVVTADGKPSAHFEHSIAITDDEPIILSKLD